jgi:exosortase/archaeosortase family protein
LGTEADERVVLSSADQRSSLPLPSSILYLLPLAGYWLVLIYYLGAQWSVFEQYTYGWAVPFLCLYLLWRKAAGRRQEAEPGNAERLGTEMLKGGPGRRAGDFSISAFQRFSLFLLALLYAVARFLHEANPVWRLTSLLWTLAVIGLTLLTIHLVWGRRAGGRGDGFSISVFQSFSFSDCAFPICFFLVAVPWPTGLETFLVQSLTRLNVATTIELLDLLGIPAIQHGNVIEVGKGVVGIDEACSGIRSLQATLMISLFLGELYRLTISRRVWLAVSGFALAFAFNVGRTLLLTTVASVKGVGAVPSWHDPAGVTILVGCFLCLWLIAWLLRGQRSELRAQRSEVGGPSTLNPQPSTAPTPRPSTSSAFSLQPLALALLAWFVLVEGGTQLWYRLHERSAAASADWSVPRPDNMSTAKVVAIPPGIRGQFRSDEDIELLWRDANGADWQLYYFRWLPAHSLARRVAIHLAKTHGPERCLPAAGMLLKSDLGISQIQIGGLELAVHQYIFAAEGKLLNVFYGIYEDQAGSTALVNRRLTPGSRIEAALAGSRNYGQRFLEVAVIGYDNPADAKAALVRELEKVIKVGTRPNMSSPLIPMQLQHETL